MIKVGDRVKATMYGKPNLQGTVIKYEHPKDSPNDGLYILNDIVTVKWDNGQTTKDYLKSF